MDKITYSEGARLAIRLRRAGWNLNDLPELLARISEIVKEETNINNGLQAMQAISFSHESNSLYKRVIKRIVRLQKKHN